MSSVRLQSCTNGNDYDKRLTARGGQAEKGDVPENVSRSREPTMLRTAIRAKPGTRRDPRPQLLSTRGTDWNATQRRIPE